MEIHAIPTRLEGVFAYGKVWFVQDGITVREYEFKINVAGWPEIQTLNDKIKRLVFRDFKYGEGNASIK